MSWWKRRYRHCWGNSLMVPHCPGQVLMEAGGISGCSQGLRHHWLLLGAGDITRHSWAQGSLLDACRDQEHCCILTWGWDIARCLQGPGALSGACRTGESYQMLVGTSSISRCNAHRDWGHLLGARGV